MVTAVKELDPENDLVQLLVTEAVKVAMESPLRDPILDAVKETTGDDLKATSEDEGSGAREKNWFTKLVQGGTVFIVMFVVLYVTLRRLTSDEPAT
jgi:hypothetical protein